MPKARFVVELVDKIRGPAKSAAGALRGLDSKLKGITKSKAFTKLNGLGSAMGKATKGIAIGAGAAVAAIGALVAGVGSIASEVDELGKRSAKLGLPIESLQRFGFVASQSGVETAQFNRGMDDFVKNVGAAKAGMGPLTTSLKKTNPALLEQLKNTKDTGAAFELMIDSLRAIEDPMLRAKAAQDAFGGSGKAMIKIAANSKAGIEALKKQATENGLVTEKQAKAAAKYNDAMDRLERTMKMVVVEGLLPFAPAIENAVKKLQKFISENKIAEKTGRAIGDMITWVTDNFETIKTWGKWIGIAAAAFIALTVAVKTVVAVMSFIAFIGVAIGKLKAAWAILMVGVKVVGLVVAAVGAVPLLIGAALIAAAVLIWTFRDEIAAFFGAVWSKIKEFSAIIWEGIKTFGQSILNGLIAAFNLLTQPQQMLFDFLTGIGSKILEAIPAMVAGAKSIGTSIIQGIVSTLSPTAIVNRVKAMGSSVLTAAKSIFGIASPSKEFAWIGEQNVKGMAMAMEDKRGVAAKSARGFGENVLDAAAPASNDNSSAAPRARGGGIVIHAEFNFNGSGSTPEEQQEVADSLLAKITSNLEVLEVAY